ncbi:hypothetical protein J2Y60_000682 [Arcicella sp. BE140]|nr:hypothetical protein [Arcicella sp. BE140]MDR6560613.1 hypothetical protein [Arcicella sp. BE51]MDR6810497.1 hypothetical protein [Arcicella sp. BE140]MDR6821847.1 hypothetical protein [Arcicella sp. BE139]
MKWALLTNLKIIVKPDAKQIVLQNTAYEQMVIIERKVGIIL